MKENLKEPLPKFLIVFFQSPLLGCPKKINKIKNHTCTSENPMLSVVIQVCMCQHLPLLLHQEPAVSFGFWNDPLTVPHSVG